MVAVGDIVALVKQVGVMVLEIKKDLADGKLSSEELSELIGEAMELVQLILKVVLPEKKMEMAAVEPEAEG